MFLITTADERAWKKDERILFLGEWCKRYSRRHIWSELDYEILPYHWDDRNKLQNDFKYLTGVYERCLKVLSDSLNALHGSNHSIRYWRILIGPWLRYFIEILYDRFLSVEAVVASGKVKTTWLLKSSSEMWIPNDFLCFQRYFLSDQWNHYIYSTLIKTKSEIGFEIIPEENTPENIRMEVHDRYLKPANTSNLTGLKKFIQQFVKWYARSIPDSLNEIVFVAGYWNRIEQTKLQLSLRQLPYTEPESLSSLAAEVDLKFRGEIKLFAASNEFEGILERLIPLQIPSAYLESYRKFSEKALAHFPKKPKAIFTANAHYTYEGFKIWAADQVDRNAKLLLVQHGGNYGSVKWSNTEEHQIEISDRFYTWGWQNPSQQKVKKMPASKLTGIKKKLHCNPQGKILLVQMSLPRYSYWIYSAPVASQLLSYLDEQIVFIKHLSAPASSITKIRLYPDYYGWDAEARFRDAGIGENIDASNLGFIAALNESRLSITTYNSTTYLETFAANFPTLLFWNPSHWELRESAQPYFEELHKAGILHYTPQSAALKVNEIYNDVSGWWNQPQVQRAKDKFCSEFAYTSRNWLQEWKAELSSVIK